MGKRLKKSARFGLPPARHQTKRKEKHGKGIRTRYEYKCFNKPEDSEVPGNCVKLTIVRKLKPTNNLKKVYQLYKSSETGHHRKRTVKEVFNEETNKPSGYRFINLSCLQTHVSEVTCHAAICDGARDLALKGESPVQVQAEVSTQGLASVLSLKCRGCQKDFLFRTSPILHQDKHSKHFDINVRAVWGSVATGNGNAHLNEFLASMDSPPLGQRTYQKIEAEINTWWQHIMQKDLDKAIEEEKQIAISKNSFHQGIPSITVICDGGWCKRSHKHSYNALGGVAIIIGAATQKLLHIGVRNKHCSLCSRAESLGCRPREHDCFKNWDLSSQAMEADIIVEGFLKANDYGVRYMTMVGDGDSSVFAHIREKVPVWGSQVSKMECANHVCKCLRNNLEKLVDTNPTYKGRGKLTKQTRIRLVTAVRCAIRMRSSLSDKSEAVKLLSHDIRNAVHHVYGSHSNCSADFCKAKAASDTNETVHVVSEELLASDMGVVEEQASLWTDGASIVEQEESRNKYVLNISDLNQCAQLLRDISIILNRVAEKSSRLIGNYTTNLAECWMHVRSKFDGGKVFNHCNRGSWHTRCYAGALRMNLGPRWSPLAWQQCTTTTPGKHFSKLYQKRAIALATCKKAKKKPSSTLQRWKRKRSTARVNATKRARMEYGPEAVDVTPDIAPADRLKCEEQFLDDNINISPDRIRDIEKETRQQSLSEAWKEERRVRLTSSHFGQVIKRNPKIKVEPLVRQMLYSKFTGNNATAIGLSHEDVAKEEYLVGKDKDIMIEPSGLVIDPTHKFLACSPDGVVTKNKIQLGLIEIKNILYNKPIDLTTAAKLQHSGNFCLEIFEDHLQLKRNHNYYFQCQGLLNICNFPWLDFIVRTVKPYQLHTERIYKDPIVWSTVMLPKLESFYTKAVLPELASPRYRQNPGIRECGIWYEPRPTQVGKKRTLKSQAQKDPPDYTSDEPSSDDSSQELVAACSTRRTGSRPKLLKFVGRTVSHQWIDDEQGTTSWYTGTVLSLVKGQDGALDAVYEVGYENEEDTFEVDHLVEDHTAGQVKFIDI